MNTKNKTWKVQIKKNCKVCGQKITGKRFRSYCSDTCRVRHYNKKRYKYQVEHARRKRDKEAEKPAKNKIQCLICGRWYRQVGSHITQVHKITAKDYRRDFGFDVKKGQLPEDYRQLKAAQAIECGGYLNLKRGKKFWFKRGQDGVGVYHRSNETIERMRGAVSNKKKINKCLVCKKAIPKRSYHYCSKECRLKYNRTKHSNYGILFGKKYGTKRNRQYCRGLERVR